LVSTKKTSPAKRKARICVPIDYNSNAMYGI